jgi:hypothetical protein
MTLLELVPIREICYILNVGKKKKNIQHIICQVEEVRRLRGVSFEVRKM